jgi:hypothetical protein
MRSVRSSLSSFGNRNQVRRGLSGPKATSGASATVPCGDEALDGLERRHLYTDHRTTSR